MPLVKENYALLKIKNTRQYLERTFLSRQLVGVESTADFLCLCSYLKLIVYSLLNKVILDILFDSKCLLRSKT